jgi:hypothetical protein
MTPFFVSGAELDHQRVVCAGERQLRLGGGCVDFPSHTEENSTQTGNCAEILAALPSRS